MAAFAPVANPDPGAYPVPNSLDCVCGFGGNLEDQTRVPGELELGGWISHDPGVVDRLLVDDGDVLVGTDNRAIGGNTGVAQGDDCVDRSEVGAIRRLVTGDGVELFPIVVGQVNVAASASTGE